MTVTPADPVAVTGCGVVSPAGAGLAALAALLHADRAPFSTPAVDDPGGYPPIGVRSVDGVRTSDFIGRKGTRRLDRMVGFGMVAAHLALESAGRPKGGDGERPGTTGVAVGTSTGSVRSVAELAEAAFRPDVAYVPSRFPNSVMNSCAGQLAVAYGFKAVNATLASGHASSASAIRFGRNAIRNDQARSVLVGGVEELCPQLAWGWHRSGTLTPGAVLGEGAAMLVVEHPDDVGGRPVLADLLATEVGHVPAVGPRRPVRTTEVLARCITRALARSGVAADDVDVVSLGAGSQRGVRRIEEDAVRTALGRTVPTVRVSDAVGDCYSAAGALQAAAVLARWSDGAHPEESLALVTSVGADGNLACFLLRRPGV